MFATGMSSPLGGYSEAPASFLARVRLRDIDQDGDLLE
jgi:hypothetical protein